MCLAVPSKILSMDGTSAMVDVYGARREVSLMLLPEAPNEGDYVLVHAGFAIQMVDYEAAQDSLRLISEMLQLIEQDSS